ncbi:hypothetical protein Taro_008574 [Colocasia esculenta]|uniref:FH2 domain-containing protein n=1 Tax=Colocasia esculenta TaxID=4460 RepID=A0A843U274_COLES|nr:hypothetical protein [Colocasia esculenta]
MKLLEAVLKTGNRMNVGTNRGDAHAFKLETLLKLVDIKGADGKTTLLHFVVQEIIRAEGSRLAAANHAISCGQNHTCTLRDDLEFKKLGLVVVSGLGGELSNVKKAAAMDSEVLTGYVSKLSRGIGKVNEALKLNGPHTAHERGRRFHEAMFQFLKQAQEEILRIQSQEHIVLSLVKETAEYFHGNAAEEEAHTFRIFLIVRDFLSILDQVCKEVAKVNERTMVGSALQQVPVPGNLIMPALFLKFQSNMAETSDEDDSSLSS